MKKRKIVTTISSSEDYIKFTNWLQKNWLINCSSITYNHTDKVNGFAILYLPKMYSNNVIETGDYWVADTIMPVSVWHNENPKFIEELTKTWGNEKTIEIRTKKNNEINTVQIKEYLLPKELRGVRFKSVNDGISKTKEGK